MLSTTARRPGTQLSTNFYKLYRWVNNSVNEVLYWEIINVKYKSVFDSHPNRQLPVLNISFCVVSFGVPSREATMRVHFTSPNFMAVWNEVCGSIKHSLHFDSCKSKETFRTGRNSRSLFWRFWYKWISPKRSILLAGLWFDQTFPTFWFVQIQGNLQNRTQ